MNAASLTLATYSDEHLADMFAALAHPARIRILRHLAGHSACNCKQVVGQVNLAQSTVSQHLKVLVEAGLVRYEPRQQHSSYSLSPAAVEVLSNSVVRLAGDCCAPAAPTIRIEPDGR
jgi:ArsR family transcriptional regulator, arsenate/arsenite/antimonite-responsive transcriptional repressor